MKQVIAFWVIMLLASAADGLMEVSPMLFAGVSVMVLAISWALIAADKEN